MNKYTEYANKLSLSDKSLTTKSCNSRDSRHSILDLDKPLTHDSKKEKIIYTLPNFPSEENRLQYNPDEIDRKELESLILSLSSQEREKNLIIEEEMNHSIKFYEKNSICDISIEGNLLEPVQSRSKGGSLGELSDHKGTLSTPTIKKDFVIKN